MSAQQNVSMFHMLAQKTRQKEAIRPDKMEHFTHTYESSSPEIYTGMRIANADNMYAYCTAHFRYARFRTGLPGCGSEGADCSTRSRALDIPACSMNTTVRKLEQK